MLRFGSHGAGRRGRDAKSHRGARPDPGREPGDRRCRGVAGRCLGGAGTCCTTRAHKTHIPQRGRVAYPWHPLCGRELIVYGERRRPDLTVLRCHIPGDERRDAMHIPAWMFDGALCGMMRLDPQPCVSLQALADLRRLPMTVRSRRASMTGPRSRIGLVERRRPMARPRPSRRSAHQPSLFHPTSHRPRWQQLPPQVQRKAIELLARLLRQAAADADDAGCAAPPLVKVTDDE